MVLKCSTIKQFHVFVTVAFRKFSMFLPWIIRKNVGSSFIIVFLMLIEGQSLPINNGFTIKHNPVSGKEGTKKLGSPVVKAPPSVRHNVNREMFSEDVVSHLSEMTAGYSNQMTRILFPLEASYSEPNYTKLRNLVNFINVPVMKQDVSDYKILVVSAPHNVRLLKGDAKPLVIYIVFPIDDVTDSSIVNIPSIYFINKSDENLDLSKKEKIDPVLIIDSNRTVTGLKSREISKFVKFKSKLSNRLNVDTNYLQFL